MTAFVTDGDERPALAITRSLGRRGIRVIVGADRLITLTSRSRYAARAMAYPCPQRDPVAFDRFLCDLVTRERIDVVIPVSDVTTRSVIGLQDRLLRHSAVAVPPSLAWETVTDKSRLLEHAASLGVPAPRTLTVEGAVEARRAAPSLRFPVVVKAFRSRIPTSEGWLGATVHYAESPGELHQLYQDVSYLTSFPSLIQERVVGPGDGVFVLFDRGRLLTAFAHRRLREKPPSGGVSVFRESVPADPELIEYSRRLLAPLGWHGVAMVEFKRDDRSGRPFLIEINGRFWGSLQLAIDSGVDFPFLTYQLARGEHVEVPASYRVGVKSRWLLGDLDHLLLRVFRRDDVQKLPEGAASRARTLIEFLKFTGQDLNYEVLQMSDLGPFRHEAAAYLETAGRAMARVARGLARLPDAPVRQTRRRRGENGHAGVVR
jgi:predicted ATP-grasp superfamily ATP-dependent carboligase